jgi:hypothetical protein
MAGFVLVNQRREHIEPGGVIGLLGCFGLKIRRDFGQRPFLVGLGAKRADVQRH